MMVYSFVRRTKINAKVSADLGLRSSLCKEKRYDVFIENIEKVYKCGEFIDRYFK